MTTLTFPHVATERPLWARAVNMLADFFDGIAEGREISRRYDQLSRLSNTELAGLGLNRTDLPSAAVNGVTGF